jgi:hypothetical protein
MEAATRAPLQFVSDALWDGDAVPLGAELVVTSRLDLVGGISTFVAYLPDPDDFTLWPTLEPGTVGRALHLWPPRRRPVDCLVVQILTGPHSATRVQVPIGVPGKDTLAAWSRA